MVQRAKIEFVQTPKQGIKDENQSGEVVKTPQMAAASEGQEPLTRKQKADQAAKAQAAKLQKEAKANDPMEKAKKHLQRAPTSIRELNSALNEAQTSAVKKNMPSRFLQEYTHQFKEHGDKLGEFRTHFEGGIGCKNFVKDAAVDIEAAHTEIDKTSKTLKAWRNSMHVYTGSSGSAKAKGKDKDAGAEAASPGENGQTGTSKANGKDKDAGAE